MSWALEDPAGEEAGGVRAAENWHAALPIIAGRADVTQTFSACCATYEYLAHRGLLSTVVVDVLADLIMRAGEHDG